MKKLFQTDKTLRTVYGLAQTEVLSSQNETDQTIITTITQIKEFLNQT